MDTSSSYYSQRSTWQKAMTPTALMALCEEAYTELDLGRQTVDSHTEEFIAERRVVERYDEEVAVFIRQVIYGTVRYRKLINVQLGAFYHHHSGQVLRGDRNKYAVFLYITLFRIEELTFSQYRRLILGEDPQKMVYFLNFVFDAERLVDSCMDEWLKLYDRPFVENLIESILVSLPEVKELLARLERTVFMHKKKQEEVAAGWKQTGSLTGKTTTVPKPFSLSLPKPKPLPPEEPPVPQYMAKPAPKPRTGPSVTEVAIEKARVENRRQVELKHANCKPFRLRTLERPSNFERLKEEITAAREAELQYIPPQTKPAPQPPGEAASVKLNTAAILREDALYKRKQAEEARVLKSYEEELRDESEFLKWQAKVRGEDERVRREEIERRKQNARQAEEAAHEARKETIAANRKRADDLKMESKEREEMRLADLERELSSKVTTKIRIVQERAKVMEAKEMLEMDKRAKAEELATEKMMNSKRIADERNKEQKEKGELIRRLRAMEKVRKTNLDSHFDPTTAYANGLLEEMSLMELRERLKITKQRQREEEEERRATIIKRKEEKTTKLLGKLANISRIRDLAHSQAAVRKQERQRVLKTMAERKEVALEEDMVSLHNRLEGRRLRRLEEAERLAQEEKLTLFEQQRLASSKGAVEEKKFLDLRAGQERATKRRQANALREATVYEATKERQQKVRMANVKREARAKREYVEEYNTKVAMLREADLIRLQSEIEQKRSLTAKEKTRVESLRERRNLKASL